jgi:recombination DNA repair RAD52 pathway protein
MTEETTITDAPIQATSAVNNNNSFQVTTSDGQQQQQSAPPTDSSNINVDQMINETNQEIGNEQAAKTAREQKKILLSKATKSLDKVATNTVLNVETNEIIGEYLEYLPDHDGKTVFDYMKDPEVTRHIQFVLPQGYKEGDKITEKITPCWIDPTF